MAQLDVPPFGSSLAALARLLAAQCTGAEESCAVPRSLPWFLTVAAVAAWAALVVGLLAVARHRRRLRAERRRQSGRRSRREHPGAELERF